MKTKRSTVESLLKFWDDENRNIANGNRFLSLFDSFDQETRHELLALFWLGREEDPAEVFEDLLNHARESLNNGSGGYLYGKQRLDEAWRKGMSTMNMI